MIAVRTVSGHTIDIEHPDPALIEIEDIARGLSHCCRFAGQLPIFYSVAQHSLLVSQLVDRSLRLAALLHDASEAYLGDLQRNLKHSQYLTGYRVLEQQVQRAIQLRFRYLTSREDCEAIKLADNLAAIYERVTLVEGRVFQTDDIPRLVSDGFVKDNIPTLVTLASRLPRSASRSYKRFDDPMDPLYPWSAEEAYDRFKGSLEFELQQRV